MKWYKLNKNVLKSIAVPENILIPFVVWDSRRTPDDEFAYDMISFLDLKGSGLTKEEMKSCWHSMLHHVPDQQQCTATHYRYEYTAEELLEHFTYYSWLETGKK